MLIIHTTHRVKYNCLNYSKILILMRRLKTQKSDFRTVQKFILSKALFASILFPLQLFTFQLNTCIPIIKFSTPISPSHSQLWNLLPSPLRKWRQSNNLHKHAPRHPQTNIPVPEPVLPYTLFFMNYLYIISPFAHQIPLPLYESRILYQQLSLSRIITFPSLLEHSNLFI